MSRKWTEEAELVESVSEALLRLVPVFPKKLVHLDELCRTFDMPISHIQILLSLRDGAYSTGDLSDRLGIAKPNITPLVDHLSARGLVERTRDLTDRRIINIGLTQAGQDMVDAFRACIARQLTPWSARLNRSDIKTLVNACTDLCAVAAKLENLPE